MDDLVITNIVRFLDQSTLITCCSVNAQFQRCAQSLIKVKCDNLMLVCQQGNRDLATWLIEQDVEGLEWGLMGACEGGHRQLAEQLMKLVTTSMWHLGLFGACKKGNRELVELLIELGDFDAEELNYGLSGACRGGHRELIQWMIDLGANDWNMGLYQACYKGYQDICEWMIRLGANDLSGALKMAYNGDQLKFAKWLIQFKLYDLYEKPKEITIKDKKFSQWITQLRADFGCN